MKLLLATGNKGKLREMEALLQGTGLQVLGLSDEAFTGLELPPEDGSTFEENALIKARYAAKATGLAAIADDSGLEVDALGGAPGVLSARFAGLDATDAENNEKLLAALDGLGDEERTARFSCVLAIVTPASPGAPERVETFSGSLSGRIAKGPTGSGGFGYDPIFFLPTRGKTTAQLDPKEKNRISHRGEAVGKFVLWAKSNLL